MTVKLNVGQLDEAIKSRGWTNREAAKKIGISQVQLWRAKLPDDDPRHNDPGNEFISGAIRALGKNFEDLFIVSSNYECVNNDKQRELQIE